MRKLWAKILMLGTMAILLLPKLTTAAGPAGPQNDSALFGVSPAGKSGRARLLTY